MPASRNHSLYAAAFGLLSLLTLSAAMAQSPRWYVEPESQGECGEECFTPATAWVYEPNGNFALGVQCEGTMVLGGPAMGQQTDPIASVEMVIDGRSYGRFDIATGLNDYYVAPTLAGGAQDWTRALRPALASGSALQLWLGPNALLEFGLGGSRAALDALDAQCGGGGANVAAAPSTAPQTNVAPAPNRGGAWPMSEDFSPGLVFAQGATVAGWTDSGNGGWLGNRAADGVELWVTLFARGSDGVFIVVAPDTYTADGSIATWRVVTSLYPAADRQPPTPIAWGPCRVLNQNQDMAFARWDGGGNPAQAWAFDPAAGRFVALAPGTFDCAYEEH